MNYQSEDSVRNVLLTEQFKLALIALEPIEGLQLGTDKVNENKR